MVIVVDVTAVYQLHTEIVLYFQKYHWVINGWIESPFQECTAHRRGKLTLHVRKIISFTILDVGRQKYFPMLKCGMVYFAK